MSTVFVPEAVPEMILSPVVFVRLLVSIVPERVLGFVGAIFPGTGRCRDGLWNMKKATVTATRRTPRAAKIFFE
jgi:hypothetical protein